MPMVSTALQSGSILFREGLEALLIISAIAAFLERAGQHAKVKALYVGALAALVASFAAAAIFQFFYSGAHDDRVEAVVMLVAAALMLYMSGWLWLKQDPRAWQQSLNAAAGRALDAGTGLSLAAIAFLAVFREGGETVLFLHVLGRGEGGFGLGFWLGIAAATLLLVVAFLAIRTFAMRLPLRPVFIFTSFFLFVMALKFIGGAIQEAQELQYIGVTPVDMPQSLIDLGFNASAEALGAQLLIALLALGGTFYGALQQRNATPSAA